MLDPHLKACLLLSPLLDPQVTFKQTSNRLTAPLLDLLRANSRTSNRLQAPHNRLHPLRGLLCLASHLSQAIKVLKALLIHTPHLLALLGPRATLNLPSNPLPGLLKVSNLLLALLPKASNLLALLLKASNLLLVHPLKDTHLPLNILHLPIPPMIPTTNILNLLLNIPLNQPARNIINTMLRLNLVNLVTLVTVVS